jgi:surface protein
MADVPVIISKSIRLREGAAPSNPVNIGTPQEPLNPDGGGGVVPHNQLAGLQGGTATERYHIDEDQYDAVNGANTLSSTNVFATIADLEGVERENNTVLFDKDYVIGNAAARTGNILFDFTGARLKANSIMLHNDIVEPTFPANAKIIFGEYKLIQDNYIYFELSNKGLSNEIVLVKIYQEEIDNTIFISSWDTSNTVTGSSNSDQIKLPLINTGSYKFIVDWGDDTINVITTWNQAETTHTYTTSGIYTIKITGECIGWSFSNTGDRLKILEISNFGPIKFTNNSNINLGVFHGCLNLNIIAVDIPDLSLVTEFTSFFRNCRNLVFNDSINNWNISGATLTNYMFTNTNLFNQPLNNWDVSNVTNMSFMFGVVADAASSAFNQNIGNWDVSNVTNMEAMFGKITTAGSGNVAFNNNGSDTIKNWDVSNVTNMASMFRRTIAFNQPINDWDVSNVTSMLAMFRSAIVFNQNLNLWDLNSVVDFSFMFQNATAFDQDLGMWDVSNSNNFASFMAGKTSANFSASNLDAIYNGWSLLSFVNTGLTISFGTIKYTAAGQAGRDILTGAPNNWSITDGGT